MARALSDSDRDQVNAELFAGRKIQAIKIYREATGQGLKEAKDAVEDMEVELRAATPERFKHGPSKKTGCMAVLSLFAGGMATAGWLVS